MAKGNGKQMSQSARKHSPVMMGRVPRALKAESEAVAVRLGIKPTQIVRVSLEHFCRAVRAGKVPT